VAISILCGITDVHLWFLIFMSQAVGLAMGFIIEVLPMDPEETSQSRFAEETPDLLPSASTPASTVRTLRKDALPV
jgi:hypothetical protein